MDHDLTRREFLGVSAAAGLAAFVNPVAGGELTKPQRHTLVAVAQTLFQHVGIGEQPYLRAVEHVAKQCRRDVRVFEAVKTSLERIEWFWGTTFSALKEGTRVRVLKGVQNTDFFGVLYRELLEGLYGSPDSWELLVHTSSDGTS